LSALTVPPTPTQVCGAGVIYGNVLPYWMPNALLPQFNNLGELWAIGLFSRHA
jgi:hypothetical protein